MPDNSHDTVGILADLIAFPTLSRSSNLQLLDYAAAHLKQAGVEARIFVGPEGDRGNLHAVIGPDVEGGIILSGHTDVVPVEGQEWTSDPFHMRADGGRLYGRGAADMKGFLACVLALAAKVDGKRLRRPIHIAFSYDEEIGCVGVRPMLEKLKGTLPKQALCLIGEPTSMQVATTHKGKLAATCTCHGVAAHSGLAPNGLNAIHLAADMVAALRRLQAEVAAGRPAATKDDVPYTTLHVGRIEGGIALNIVPDRCRFDFEIRNLPGESASALMQRLEAEAGLLAAAHRQRFPAAGIEIAVTNAYPSLSTPSEDPAVATLLGMTGTQKPIGVAFGTEGGLFREALGCTTVVCGPGSMQQGHKPDE
jgi:acetylornithine deacetylase